MRTKSRNIVGAIGLGILGASYLAGTQVDTGISYASNNAAPSPTATATSDPQPSTTPTPTATKSSSTGSSTSSATSTSNTQSASVSYRYGVVKLKVTKKSGKISAISTSGSTASDGRSAAYPYLVDYAIADNGSSFTADQIANMSGATYTMDAFLTALDKALAKF